MNPLILAAVPQLVDLITGVGKKAIDKLFPDDPNSPENSLKREQALAELRREANQMLREERQLEAANLLEQIRLTSIEASSDSLFKSGWRPGVGWTCVFGLCYQLVLNPLLTFISAIFGGPAAPSLDIETLLAILAAILGIGHFRTREKLCVINAQSQVRTQQSVQQSVQQSIQQSTKQHTES